MAGTQFSFGLLLRGLPRFIISPQCFTDPLYSLFSRLGPWTGDPIDVWDITPPGPTVAYFQWSIWTKQARREALHVHWGFSMSPGYYPTARFTGPAGTIV